MKGGFNTFNIGLIVAGAILITAGIKGVAPKQVVVDSVGSIKDGSPITIVGSSTSMVTPNTTGNPDIATGK